MNTAWESFHRAVHELASSATIKQRLTCSFSKHLNDLDVEELPPELHSMFLELTRDLTSVAPLRGETAVCATVRKMSNDEAEAVAQRIVEMLGQLTRHLEQPVRAAKSRRVLSLYAAEA
jgi:hypothetical protein